MPLERRDGPAASSSRPWRKLRFVLFYTVQVLSPARIAALVVAVALLIGVLMLIVRRLRIRNQELIESLRAELEAAEGIVLGPHPGMYRGASDGSSKVKGNAVVVLTPERLIITKLTGGRVEVPLAEITSVREDKWFLRSATGGHVHVIVAREQGELGFFVEPRAEWVAALRERCK